MVQTGLAGFVQSVLVKHWTQLPLPSHLTPPPAMQVVPIATGCVPHVQLEHVATVQGFSVGGQSEGAWQAQPLDELELLEALELLLEELELEPPFEELEPPFEELELEPPFEELEPPLDELVAALLLDEWVEDVPPVPLPLPPVPFDPPLQPLPAHVTRGKLSTRPARQIRDERKTTSLER